jgi:hypothetical protein
LRKPFTWLIFYLIIFACGVAQAGSALTITTHIQLNEFTGSHMEVASDGLQSIWLAGVIGAETEEPTLLTLTWMLDDSGWYPQWRLCLLSDAGLLMSGESSFQLVTTAAPINGREYYTTFSYDPEWGVLSVRVEDISVGNILYVGNIKLNPYSGALYPEVNLPDTAGELASPIQLKEMATYPYFVPIGATAQLYSRKNAAEQFSAVRAYDRRDEWALHVTLPDRPLENKLRLVHVDKSQQTDLLFIADADADTLIPIVGASIPIGTAEFVLDYVVDGEKWEIDRLPLEVGAITVELSDLTLTTGGNGEPALAASLSVFGDADLPPFAVNANYKFSVPGAVTPLHEQWREDSGTVVIPVNGAGLTTLELPITVPLGDLAELMDENEVFVEVAVSADLAVPFNEGDIGRLILGERTPVFATVGDYIVLRGDFHGHSTASDGHLSPTDRLWETYMYGYDVFALTDHRTISGYFAGVAYADQIGLTLIRGFETGIDGKQHLIVLGTDDDYEMRDEHFWARQPNTSRVFYQDQVREIIAHGGYIIYAHPGGEWVPPGPYKHPDGIYGLTDEIRWMLDSGYLHGVESIGAFHKSRRDAPYRWAIEYDLALFDVSDVHGSRNFSRAYEAPVTLVLATENTPEEVLEALRHKRTLIWRNGQLRGMNSWLTLFIDAMLDVRLIERDGKPTLELTNFGSLHLFGSVRTKEGNGYFTVLPPMSSAYVPCDETAESIDISWGNVFDGPEHALVTTHLVR